jgi:hypothetical protein
VSEGVSCYKLGGEECNFSRLAFSQTASVDCGIAPAQCVASRCASSHRPWYCYGGRDAGLTFPAGWTLKEKVRDHLIHFGSIFVLVCFCAQVSELVDQWDHTLKTGRDVEYTAIVAALVAGTVFVLASVVAALARASRVLQTFLGSLDDVVSAASLVLVPSITQSPPTTLRI